MIKFITVARKIGRQDLREIRFRRTWRRAVVVGEVEMGNAQVKGATANRPAGVKWNVIAEIMPKAQRQRRQLQPAAPALAVSHFIIASAGGRIIHKFNSLILK